MRNKYITYTSIVICFFLLMLYLAPVIQAKSLEAWHGCPGKRLKIIGGRVYVRYTNPADYMKDNVYLIHKETSGWTELDPSLGRVDVKYSKNSPNFYFDFSGINLPPSTDMVLYYKPDPTAADPVVLWEGTTTPAGTIDSGLQSFSIDKLPIDTDTNPGAKLWMSPKGKVPPNWSPSDTLFEHKLINYWKTGEYVPLE